MVEDLQFMPNHASYAVPTIQDSEIGLNGKRVVNMEQTAEWSAGWQDDEVSLCCCYCLLIKRSLTWTSPPY
uniref:Uncharacterized protein n=1 Tax=Oryza brachyantha TaxID=4533 RepID=J3N020_ORYBR